MEIKRGYNTEQKEDRTQNMGGRGRERRERERKREREREKREREKEKARDFTRKHCRCGVRAAVFSRGVGV